MSEHFNSSDDEAPDEVNFETTKAAALRSRREEREEARREAERQKEKRRRRHQLFLEQKKRRLLPDHVLEKIDTATDPSGEEKEEKEGESGGLEEEEEVKGEGKKGVLKQPEERSLKGRYSVKRLRDGALSAQQQAAMEFVRTRMYGPGQNRTTTNHLLSLDNKRGPNKGAAVQFVKKGWAAKRKEKAEREKQQWIRKQQVPST